MARRTGQPGPPRPPAPFASRAPPPALPGPAPARCPPGAGRPGPLARKKLGGRGRRRHADDDLVVPEAEHIAVVQHGRVALAERLPVDEQAVEAGVGDVVPPVPEGDCGVAARDVAIRVRQDPVVVLGATDRAPPLTEGHGGLAGRGCAPVTPDPEHQCHPAPCPRLHIADHDPWIEERPFRATSRHRRAGTVRSLAEDSRSPPRRGANAAVPAASQENRTGLPQQAARAAW